MCVCVCLYMWIKLKWSINPVLHTGQCIWCLGHSLCMEMTLHVKEKRQTVITDCLCSPLVWRVKPLRVSPLTDVAITFGWERWIWVSICPLKTEVNELIQQSVEHLDHPEFTRYERETQHKVSRLFSLVFQNVIMPSFSICFAFLLFF